MYHTSLTAHQPLINNATELPVDISATVAPWLDKTSLGRYACCSKAIHAVASLKELWDKFKPEYLNWLITNNPFPKRISTINANSVKLHDKWIISANRDSIRIFDRTTMAMLAAIPLPRMDILAEINGRILCRDFRSPDLQVVNLTTYELTTLNDAVANHLPQANPLLLADGSVLSHPDRQQVNLYDQAGELSHQCITRGQVSTMGYWNNSIITVEDHAIMRYPLTDLAAPVEVSSRPHPILGMLIVNETAISITDEPLILITDLTTHNSRYINVPLPELSQTYTILNSNHQFFFRKARNSTTVLNFNLFTTTMQIFRLPKANSVPAVTVLPGGRTLIDGNGDLVSLPGGFCTHFPSPTIQLKLLKNSTILPDPEHCRVFVIEGNRVSAFDYSLPKWYAKKTKAVVDRLWVKPITSLIANLNYGINRYNQSYGNWRVINPLAYGISGYIRHTINHALTFRRTETIVVACAISVLLISKLYPSSNEPT